MTIRDEADGPRRRAADPLASFRPALFLSTAVIVGACVALAVVAGGGWSWPLLIWGVALGPLAMTASRFTVRFSARYLELPPDKVQELERRDREQRRTTYPIVVGMGLGIGIAAAGLQSVAFDGLFTVITVISVGLPLLMLPLLKRRLSPGE